MKHLFIILVMLSAVAVLFLPFVAWWMVDHGRGAQAFATVMAWISLLAYLLVRGAT